jgi:cell division protein FtsN
VDQTETSGVAWRNRRLIIAFVLLVLVCGVFFLLGFIEGKRQGVAVAAREVASQPASQTADSSRPKEEGGRPASAKAPESTAAGETGAPLQWYNNVSKEEPPATKLVPPAPVQPPKTAAAAQETKPTAADSGPITYAVQVGAFRNREDAEKRGDLLKEKSYQFVIEPPVKAGDLFLVKVGKFKSRADAQAAKLKLQKDGFNTFIKTN